MTTIPVLLRTAAQKYGAKPALVSRTDGATSFAALDVLADQVAKAFLGGGLAKGDRVGIWAPNMAEWVAAAAGAQRVGGVIVPLNTRLKGGEVADIVRRAGITRLVSIGDFLNRYYPEMLRSEAMPDLRDVIVLRSPPTKLAGRERTWDAFLADGDTMTDAQLAARAAAVTPDDRADIMFTSGTTGQAKGALFDHKRSLGGGRAWHGITGMTADDRYCVFGPFSHNASYKAGWVSGLMTGSTVYWPEAYDGEAVLDLIAANRITVMAAPPTVWQEVLAHPNRPDWDISSLRFISTGGTTIPMELMRRLRRELPGTIVSTGYGMTECCGSATQTLPDDDIERVAHTVGKAIPGTEVRVADRASRPVPAGQAGEVLIRDDKLLIEYLDSPEATRAALDADGWLHSGDIGVFDADGYLKITDRLKDMYIVGGFNVYPAEIERQMGSLDGLHACAVVGVPDGRLGEVGHAFIVRSAGSTLTEAEVIAWSKTNLANYKVPRGVTFVDALPMNATGKILKFALKQML
ncbi:AMP-binding protein [Nitrospirillum sp. BR 11164]|uniref:AMP-binding protein n=1 Tax=Nitrospirillum sp. BR 11164 TaxID=3104324 RepID=UPI002B001E67|nr:AMP-binding protein [Nitrospirillum sp. BR 11164]MEA1652890.1 AMP-binding protein [Nitrospirillum sp. BR 11164]